MASSSSSPHSSQPLHNFELPPLLKWHRKGGKSAGTPKRYRTTKTAAAPPPPQPEPPLLHLVAAAALFEADLMPPPPPHEPVGSEAKETAALDDEFERLSLLREESRRNSRSREADQPPVISYSRNHQKKSTSSSSAKNHHSFNKTSSISHAPEPRRSPPAFPVPPGPKVTLLNYFDSGNRRRSTNAAAIEAESYSWSSFSKEKRSDAKSEKFASSSSSSAAWKKHDWFNKSSPPQDADAFSKIPFYKKFEFVSKSKQDYSEFNVKIEVPEEDHSSKIEKLSMVAAAPNPNLYYLKKSAQANSKDKMKSKVAEDSHLPPKKKPSFAFASPINPKIPLLKPKLEQSDAPEKKSKPAESDALKIKIEPKEVAKEQAENPKKKDTDLTEATRLWNLRPRIPKGKDKDKDKDKDKGKAVAQPQRKSGGASKSGAEKEKTLGIAISLTKEEIEEDIFALTGRKPARRPKKRPRNVQKNMDAVFPGLWLMSISKDTYRVSEKK